MNANLCAGPLNYLLKLTYIHKGQFPVSGIFRAGGILDNKWLDGRIYSISERHFLPQTIEFPPTSAGKHLLVSLSQSNPSYANLDFGVSTNFFEQAAPTAYMRLAARQRTCDLLATKIPGIAHATKMFENGHIRPYIWYVQVGLGGAAVLDYGTGHRKTMLVKTTLKRDIAQFSMCFKRK